MTSDPLNSPEPNRLVGTPDPMNPIPANLDSTSQVEWTTGLSESLDKLQVEDEVLEAVEEGKSDARPYQEAKTQEPKEAQEAQKVRLREETNARLRGTPSFIADLRRADTPLTRTCGYCLTRKALGNFLRGIESNFCLDCEG